MTTAAIMAPIIITIAKIQIIMRISKNATFSRLWEGAIKTDYGVTVKTVIISHYCRYQVHQHI